jgi:hypothetical protein
VTEAARHARIALVVLGLLAVTSVVISFVIVTPRPMIDDTFIGVRYAANWAGGNGIVFNPGDPVEGFTSITWVALMTAAYAAGIDCLVATQIVNVAAQVLGIWLVYQMGRTVGRTPLESLIAPALLAMHESWVAYPMMGMTTSTFAFVLACSVFFLARGALDTLRGSLGLGALLLLLSLVRFDGVGLAVGLLLYPVLVQRKFKATMPAFAVLVVGLVIFNAWRFSYYGKPFPNTFYAKNSPISSDMVIGYHYIEAFVIQGGPYGLLLLLAPLAAWWRGSQLAKVAIWLCGGHLVYTIAVGGDWMTSYRFMCHVMPLYAFLFAEGLWKMRDLGVSWGRSKAFATAVISAMALLALADNLDPLRYSRWLREDFGRGGKYWHIDEAFAIGDFLDETLPADTLVATEWAGVIPSRMRQPILDILGLNDSEIIARDDFKASNMGRLPTPEYVVGREPEVVIVVARIWPSIEEAREGINARPEGTLIADFYAALREPENGYELCVMQVENGYWPCLVRPGSPLRASLCVGG